MGIYFRWYVVDLPEYESFLKLSMGAALNLHATKGSNPERVYHISSPDNREIHYGAMPGQRPFWWKLGSERTALKPGEETGHAVLTRTLAEYLGQGGDMDLMKVLGTFEDCPATPYIHPLQVSESGRWWVGSLLESVEKSGVLIPADYRTMALLFRKLLRKIDCGKDLPGEDDAFKDVPLPGRPRDDDGHHLGVWTTEDIQTASILLREIRSREDLLYHAPPLGFEGGRTEEFTAWVQRQVDLLLRIETLGYQKPMLISFLF